MRTKNSCARFFLFFFRLTSCCERHCPTRGGHCYHHHHHRWSARPRLPRRPLPQTASRRAPRPTVRIHARIRDPTPQRDAQHNKSQKTTTHHRVRHCCSLLFFGKSFPPTNGNDACAADRPTDRARFFAVHVSQSVISLGLRRSTRPKKDQKKTLSWS